MDVHPGAVGTFGAPIAMTHRSAAFEGPPGGRPASAPGSRIAGRIERAGAVRLARIAGVVNGVVRMILAVAVVAITPLGKQIGDDVSGAQAAIAIGGLVGAANIVIWLVGRPGNPGRLEVCGTLGLAAAGVGLSVAARDVLTLVVAFGLSGPAAAMAIRFRQAARARYPAYRGVVEGKAQVWSNLVPLLAAPGAVVALIRGSWAWSALVMAALLLAVGLFLALFWTRIVQGRSPGTPSERASGPQVGWRDILLSRSARWGLLGLFAAGVVYQAPWSMVEPTLSVGFGSLAGVIAGGFIVIRSAMAWVAAWAAHDAVRAPRRRRLLPGLATLAIAALLVVPLAADPGSRWASLLWAGLIVLAVEAGSQVSRTTIRVEQTSLGHKAALMGEAANLAGIAAGGVLAGQLEPWLLAGVLLGLALLAIWTIVRSRRRASPYRAYVGGGLGNVLVLSLDRDARGELRATFMPARSGRASTRPARPTRVTDYDWLLFDLPRADAVGESEEQRAERILGFIFAFGPLWRLVARPLPRSGRLRPWLPLIPIIASDGKPEGICVWLRNPDVEFAVGAGQTVLTSPLLGRITHSGRKLRDQ